MLQADALWLYSGPGAKSDVELPGKLFEYLRAGKPIFAMIHPEGVCAEVLKPSGLGFIADNSDPEAIKSQFLRLYQLWEQGKLAPKPDWGLIRGFERQELTRRLAEVFDTTLAVFRSGSAEDRKGRGS